MSDFHQVVTPENVELDYEIAGIGSRFLALVIDTLVQIFFAGSLIAVLVLLGVKKPEMLRNIAMGFSKGLLLGIIVFFSFLISFGYFLILEIAMNGQTIGKKFLNIRVRKEEGNAPGFWDILLRNFLRLVDFLPAFYGIGLVVMFLNQKSKRLGDYAAGTIVVRELSRKKIKTFFAETISQVPSGASSSLTNSQYPWLHSMLSFITEQEYLLLKNIYFRRTQLSNFQNLAMEVLQRINVRAGLEECPKLDQYETVRVLEEVLAEYEKMYVGE